MPEVLVWASAIASLVGVILTGALVVATFFYAVATMRLANTTERSFRADKMPLLDFGVVRHRLTEQAVVLELRMMNVGRVPIRLESIFPVFSENIGGGDKFTDECLALEGRVLLVRDTSILLVPIDTGYPWTDCEIGKDITRLEMEVSVTVHGLPDLSATYHPELVLTRSKSDGVAVRVDMDKDRKRMLASGGIELSGLAGLVTPLFSRKRVR